VSVHNVATQENGDLDVIDGSAYVPDKNFSRELNVEFLGCKSIFLTHRSLE
jgi:lipocalin